jgi:hypothetical protein
MRAEVGKLLQRNFARWSIILPITWVESVRRMRMSTAQQNVSALNMRHTSANRSRMF